MRKYKRYWKNNCIYILEAFAISAFMVTVPFIPDMIHYFLDEKRSTKILDSDEMSSINKDYDCHLFIPDSDIEFPVVRGTDNLKYLHTAVTIFFRRGFYSESYGNLSF